MNNFRSMKWGVGLFGFGLAVAGCQAPGTLPRASRPLPKPQPVAAVSVPLPKKTSVLDSLQPADSLPPCRPIGRKESLSLTRFLQDMESQPQPKPATAEAAENTQISAQQFQIPKGLPGSDVPPLEIPQYDPNVPEEEYRAEIRKAYTKLPEVPPLPFSPSDVLGEQISLQELQQIAYANSPLLPAVAARVEQARGEAIQAGLCPNPETGYVADSINTGDTAGYHGVFASQTLITANKLDYARAVEMQDVVVAEYELRKTQIDLATAVRENYFRALVAQERLKYARGLAALFSESYDAQIELVTGGEAAPYEPLQIRVFAVQALNDAIQAGNEYIAAWRQLTAVLNSPNLTPRELAGSPEMPVPEISYEAALEILLARHTELAVAQTQISRSQLNIALQQRRPIPDVTFEGAAQYDDTSVLNDMAFNVQVSLPVPIFNKNQGNIYTAESQLVENHNQLTATQNDLAAQLADVYARYLTNRQLAENYRDHIIPDQVRTYRSTYQRFRQGADEMDFAQIVTSQQQLGEVIRTYVDVLGNQWQAVVDLAELLQADDVFYLGQPAGLTLEAPCPPNALQVPIPE